MLEPPHNTHSTASGDEPDTLEDCQILVTCIFEFLQTTQPRRYGLQAQLTINCKNLLKVVQMEKEKRVDITAALKSAEREENFDRWMPSAIYEKECTYGRNPSSIGEK